MHSDSVRLLPFGTAWECLKEANSQCACSNTTQNGVVEVTINAGDLVVLIDAHQEEMRYGNGLSLFDNAGNVHGVRPANDPDLCYNGVSFRQH